MGWGIVVNGIEVRSVGIAEIPARIAECKDNIQGIERQLIALVANTSNTYPDEHGDIPIVDYAPRIVSELLDDYAYNTTRLALLCAARDNPDEVRTF